MQDFIAGQRWICDAELQLGLGTVLDAELRTVTLVFMATGETRTYARQSAPLTRVRFAPGDTIEDDQGQTITVTAVDDADGLLVYTGTNAAGQTVSVPETALNNLIQLNRPRERLFNGQIDPAKWFELRYRTLLHLNRLAHSDLYGLTGCRTSLIAHQLYIAHEVATRYAPRVLLADEVGLGKTIEAGLILNQQLLTERARRVLLVVPESLVHQWLVEMLRRFNRLYHIFDEPRCEAVEAGQGDGGDAGATPPNPFHTEQLILCSQQFLRHNPRRFAQALQGDWDILVVDEAHHLEWTPQQASPEYQQIEQLAAVSPGVLLLTATPEQLGKLSHFARLRLLDPDRFPDFDTFAAEESDYEPIASAIEALMADRPLGDAERNVLDDVLADDEGRQLLETLHDPTVPGTQTRQARADLINALLDRHGTGRVLFRNTRAAVQGFPQRRVESIRLPMPADYDDAVPGQELTRILSPERRHPSWTQFDPRVDWLATHLAGLRPDKVLIIAASADTVIELAAALRKRHGIHAALFHEGLGLVERDRAAAWFADPDNGTQALICSEIGSEGRNFQFAHHLVLFDLPLNPDLLEQRIGRLDRIGQQQTIDIHVPCLAGSAGERLFRWYHEALDSFRHTCPAGHSVFLSVYDELVQVLTRQGDIEALISRSRAIRLALNDKMHRGRDRLLEYNSCRPGIAAELLRQATAAEADDCLAGYMDTIFDCFGIDVETHSERCLVIRPGAHMVSRFPGLAEDGMTVTFDRATALANEDVQFLTWEHPLTMTAMDMALAGELGNTAVSALPWDGVRPGTLLLESIFVLEAVSSEQLQVARYFPPTMIRIVLDENGQDHSDRLDADTVHAGQTAVDQDTARQIVDVKQTALAALVDASAEHAALQLPALIASAHRHSQQRLQSEINRLQVLRRVNPNIRDEEIAFFQKQSDALQQVIELSRIRLDAMRVIVAT